MCIYFTLVCVANSPKIFLKTPEFYVETTVISLFVAAALIRICSPFFKGEF